MGVVPGGGGLLSLHIVACHGHDCLLSESLLGDLLHYEACSECDWLLCVLLGCFFVLLSFEEYM